MATESIQIPHVPGFDFGVERLSGSPMNLVVNQTPTPPLMAAGSNQSFEVTRISATRDLQESLGIDIEASYGCASFGAGVSGRFSFAKTSNVHRSALFFTVTATVHHADLSIDNPVLTDPASHLADNATVFAARYGDMFCRAQKRGGLFVGLMKVETTSSDDATAIEAELKGSYGLFSADAQGKFKKILQKHDATCYCTLYTEGGPSIRIDDPTDPTPLLVGANTWKDAMYAHPDQYSVPYSWTLSATTIAEGPLPPDAAQIQHCQDILQYCARERLTLLDQLNQLTWIYEHQERFDWTDAAPVEAFKDAARLTQADLDLVASCASWTSNNPTEATFPAAYALSRGETYPSAVIPEPMPQERPGHQEESTTRWERYTLAQPGSAATTGGVAACSKSPRTIEVWWVPANTVKLQAAHWVEGVPWALYEDPFFEQWPEYSPSRQAGLSACRGFGEMSMSHIGVKGHLYITWWLDDERNVWYGGAHMMDSDRQASTEATLATLARRPKDWYAWWVEPDGSIYMSNYKGAGYLPNTKVAEPGSASTKGAIATASREPNRIDIWWIGPDGSVQTAGRVDGSGWTFDNVAPGGSAAITSPIVAVAPSATSMQVWWIGQDGSVRTATWTGGPWGVSERAPAGAASPDTTEIAAIAPTGSTIQLWWIGADGSVQTAAWAQDAWAISEFAPAGSASTEGAIAAVNRTPNDADVW